MSEPTRQNGNGPALALRAIARSYREGPSRLQVLDGAALDIHPGEVVALIGPSGSGKSTLLHIAGLLEKPDSGAVVIGGEDMAAARDARRTRVRRLEVGFVYQFHHLLPEFSALENVLLPQLIANRSRGEGRKRAGDLLDRLGLAARARHRPAELSGGEQQRVAIARALANRPRLLLADEPTGNLDPRTAGHVHEELLHLVRTEGLAALIATHNLELASGMDRIVRLENGRLVEERR
ncbi:ABC transporter ATP-binding protein [Kaustia mangrovi]|uniref:ABC transporter ATP-binding protein n=1 Tax=Kaustia mangrovi TaxID=2593653 RepID=A0A7S8C160_9HYPH|nr:ABC transporter ATP-binding protein [Kaustia mangrovi]QPC41466.1 ABC transporter ATP-binding protein [Kaustia mangrovi]